MKFVFDTNVYFAAIFEKTFFPKHRDVFLRVGPSTYLSSIVRFELLQGARGDLGRARVARATRVLERIGRVIAPSHNDWVLAGTVQGKIWDDHASLRTKHLENDLLIACSARRNGACVITENQRDFEIIERYLPHRWLSMDHLATSLS